MKQKASIVFAVTNDLSYDQRMQRICETLVSAGYKVELIGRHRKDSRVLSKRPFAQHRMHCFFDKGPLFYAEYNIRLFLLLLRHKAEIFGACDLDTALAIRFAAKWKRRKSVFDAHEHFSEVPEVERRRVVKNIWNWIGRKTIPRFQLRYTVSETLANVLAEQYAAPFAVVRNVPVDNGRGIVPARERENLIVYQGALNEGRGLEFLIEAMSALPEMKLLLIGEGDLSGELRSLVKKLHLTDRVEFAGFILPEKIAQRTASAKVGMNVLESRSKSYYYSLANKFFDYIHAGIPSINMRFPEYEKIIGTYRVGICMDQLNAESIANAVRELTKDPVQYDQMIDECVAARREHTWEKERERLLELYSLL